MKSVKDIPFSVMMCVCKRDNPEFFEIAIESIINQTIEPNEVVIVADGPITDKVHRILSKYKSDSRFKIIYLKENQGHGNARRAGLQNCKNEIVALMDADDISVPNRFEQQLKVFF